MPRAVFRCIRGCETHPLDARVYACQSCGDLLEVHHEDPGAGRDAAGWKALFDGRHAGVPGPEGSGVWRFHEWVLPDLPREDVVTLGEGATPLVEARRYGEARGLRLLVKQCGHTLSGSFKDLGMTVLVSQVSSMKKRGIDVRAVACASTGDTSAALAAYGAAAGLRTLVLLPRGKISAAQLVQPLAHGARVIAIDTDFDGCMVHVQRLADEAGVYLANSKNSLRIEGQKTVALEIAQGLGWSLPDWVAIPGGNLGNVSALVRGFTLLRDAGITDRIPRVLCAQAAEANPLYRAYRAAEGSAGGGSRFGPLEPLTAGPTAATAIRIGNPVSFPKAVAALEAADGVVASISERAITDTARAADAAGLYVCPHTAVALAGVDELRAAGTIEAGQTVVVVATAHGLKFTEFKTATAAARGVTPIEVPNDYAAVEEAALR